MLVCRRDLDQIDWYSEDGATIQCRSQCQMTALRLAFPWEVPQVCRTCDGSEIDSAGVSSSNKILDPYLGLFGGFQGLCELPKMLHKVFYLIICNF